MFHLPDWVGTVLFLFVGAYLLLTGIQGILQRRIATVAMTLLFRSSRGVPNEVKGRNAVGMSLAQAFIGAALITVILLFVLDGMFKGKIYDFVPLVIIVELIAFLTVYIIVMRREKRLRPDDWHPEGKP